MKERRKFADAVPRKGKPMKKEEKDAIARLLDDITAIARNGLAYSENPYDRERYEKLLKLACEEYSNILDIPASNIKKIFMKEAGQITPKVGVDCAVFDRDGRILLEKRSDDGRWSLPCGWVEVNESPQEALARELEEELFLKVKVGNLIAIVPRPSGSGGFQSMYHLLYLCRIIKGTPKTSNEVSDFGYFKINEIKDWHGDHKKEAEIALRYWKKMRRERNAKTKAGANGKKKDRL